MKYLHNLKDIKSISRCRDGRFVVTFSDFSISIMDDLGRVQDKTYKNGYLEQRTDGLFRHYERYRCLDLLDRDGNVLAAKCIDIDDESYDGILFYIDEQGVGRYIKKDGTPFLEGLDIFSSYANGIGSVRLPNGDVALISELEFEQNRRSYKMSDLFDQSEFNYDISKYNLYILGDVDFLMPFINRDYTVFCKDNVWCVIDKRGNFVHQLNDYLVSYNDSDIITEAAKQGDKSTYKIYNMRLDKYVTPPTHTMITGGVDGIIKREVDGQNRLFRQDGSMITDRQFDGSGECHNDMIPIYYFNIAEDWKFTYLNQNTGKMFSELYDYASEFIEGLGVVEKDGLRYYIDKNERIYGEGYRRAECFHEGRAAVAKRRKCFYIDRNFEKCSGNFDMADNFYGGFGIVKIGDSYDAVKKSGFLLSQISWLAEQVESDPRYFLDLKHDMLKDVDILDGLYNLAMQSALSALSDTSNELERRRVKALCEKIEDSYNSLKNKAKIYE